MLTPGCAFIVPGDLILHSDRASGEAWAAPSLSLAAGWEWIDHNFVGLRIDGGILPAEYRGGPQGRVPKNTVYGAFMVLYRIRTGWWEAIDPYLHMAVGGTVFEFPFSCLADGCRAAHVEAGPAVFFGIGALIPLSEYVGMKIEAEAGLLTGSFPTMRVVIGIELGRDESNSGEESREFYRPRQPLRVVSGGFDGPRAGQKGW